MKKKDLDIPRCCEFCRFADGVNLTGDMLCTKKGIVPKDYVCRGFVYDALKRVVHKPLKLTVPQELSDDL